MANLRFFWNGIKGSDGKLQKAFFSNSSLINYPEGTLTIYAKGCRSFSPEVREVFTVENKSDIMTDYFEIDRIRVRTTHPLHEAVNQAVKARKIHYQKRSI